ncbi:MAG: hypothetical protein II308_07650 [Muribaculaceae bacterium]|nr:hypothetical protein [Muribaculaceae bacterium]
MKVFRFFTCIVLALVSISSFGQITNINYIANESHFTPQLKIVNDNLLFTTPVGVYFITLPHECGSFLFEAYPYAFRGIAVNDFVSNGNKMLAAQTNNVGHILVMTEGNDTRNHILFTPQEFIPTVRPDDMYSMFYECFDVVNRLVQNPNDKNELLASISGDIMRSKDFGQTWENMLDHGTFTAMEQCIAYNPNDTKMIFYSDLGAMQMIGADKFMYTFDGGETWQELKGFYMHGSVAFNPADPNFVVLAGSSVAVSKDGCKTWEFTKNLDDLDGPAKIAFDTRTNEILFSKYRILGGDNMKYGIYYSDDLGATWKELCELPFDGVLTDFAQYGSKIYCISSECEICEIDLEKTDVGVSEVITNDAIRMRFGENQISWQSEKTISRVEVISADGIILAQQQTDSPQGEMTFSDELTGVAVIAFHTADGQRITRKINL